MAKRQEVVCLGCGIVRYDKIDAGETEKDGHLTAKHTCRACGCPYVETRGQAMEE